jgi:hypothetical protein
MKVTIEQFDRAMVIIEFLERTKGEHWRGGKSLGLGELTGVFGKWLQLL